MSSGDLQSQPPIARETWQLSKPSVWSDRGVVTSQHYLASEVGARVLSQGGNAVDAAVAAGAAIGTVEPWMSGLGGCGQMVVYLAREKKAQVVDFGLMSPASIDPSDYPLAAGTGSDLFSWPAVHEDRNVWGPYSAAVPTLAAGLATACERFGTKPFSELLQPAIAMAESGLPVDWYTTLKIASAAPKLAQFPSSKAIYLPDGFVPAGDWSGPLPRIALSNLAGTLRSIAEDGAESFYRGPLAERIVADCRSVGIKIGLRDLGDYRPRVVDALTFGYRDANIFAAPGLTAGPTLAHTLSLLESAEFRSQPSPATYRAYADAIGEAYRARLETMGDGETAPESSCTTHISVADREGNLVALTQTLLSLFGSKVVLPDTGILLNNGMMWFDPRPGRPNSLAPAKRPLSNMCPTVVEVSDRRRFALGASGGRRIMPAVAQLTSLLVDHGMTLDEAFHTPRIDTSGSGVVAMDGRLGADVEAALAAEFPVERWQHGVYPAMYACPNAAGHFDGRMVGNAYVTSPWAFAASA